MAHIAKYKKHSVGHMLAHYRRDPSALERDNVNPDRTHLNYTIVAGDATREPNWSVVADCIEQVNREAKAAGKRATRKDAVVMADLVVTLPENVAPGDEDEFWHSTFDFFAGKVGCENILAGFVHRDEERTRKDPATGKAVKTGVPVRDHMHVPFTPILNGRFNFKEMCPRSFYKTLHRELGDYLEARLGYRPDIELSEEQQGEKALSQVRNNKHIDATRDAIADAEDRLECLRPCADVADGFVGIAAELDAVRAEIQDWDASETGRRAEILARVDGCRRRIREIVDGLAGRVQAMIEAVEWWFGEDDEPEEFDRFDRVAESHSLWERDRGLGERSGGGRGAER